MNNTALLLLLLLYKKADTTISDSILGMHK